MLQICPEERVSQQDDTGKTEQENFFFSFLNIGDEEKIVCVCVCLCVPAPGLAQRWVTVPSQRGESGDKVKHGREESEPRLKPRTDTAQIERSDHLFVRSSPK